jgi:hypothetical protein
LIQPITDKKKTKDLKRSLGSISFQISLDG